MYFLVCGEDWVSRFKGSVMLHTQPELGAGSHCCHTQARLNSWCTSFLAMWSWAWLSHSELFRLINNLAYFTDGTI